MTPTSTPTLCGFAPVIPYQREVLDLVRDDFDYTAGNLEILLSGAYGSAKSVLLAHLAVTHCLLYPGARVCVARKALPDLRRTIFAEILEHIDDDLQEGVDYEVNRTQLAIRFRNGSEIISISWSDRKYKKARSLKLSMVVIEELTESDEEDRQAFTELKARLRRIPGIPENLLVCATNPDSPAHWAYTYFIEPNTGAVHPTRKVFYSRTADNPFLDASYISQLRRDMNSREVERYVEGKWVELTKDVIYWAYDAVKNYRESEYKVSEAHPIGLSWDFNIGYGKPLSCCAFQYVDDTFHFFAEVVVEGARTEDSVREMAERGVLDFNTEYVVYGDASGRSRDTRSRTTDYDIIMEALAAHIGPYGQVRARKLVPLSNPPVRTRHNRVNAYCCNADGARRLYVYKACPTLHKGMRLVALKQGGQYVEDDSKEYQHVTTPLGYGVVGTLLYGERRPQGSREL